MKIKIKIFLILISNVLLGYNMDSLLIMKPLIDTKPKIENKKYYVSSLKYTLKKLEKLIEKNKNNKDEYNEMLINRLFEKMFLDIEYLLKNKIITKKESNFYKNKLNELKNQY